MTFHSVGNVIIPTDGQIYIFQRGRLNHQPDVIGFISGIECEDCMWIENLYGISEWLDIC